MKKILFVLVYLIIAFSCKSIDKPYTSEMKSELKRMYKEDQDTQNLLIEFIHQKKERAKLDSIDNRIKIIFKNNYKTILNYFNSYGYPRIKENDKFSSFAFWLIAQHCDHDLKFQIKVLKRMKFNLKNDNVDIKNYAYLYDRIKKNRGELQLYGTQKVRNDKGIYVSYKTKDEKNVNLRRKSVGLGSLEEYLKGE